MSDNPPSAGIERLNTALAQAVTMLEVQCSPQELAHSLSRKEYTELVVRLDAIQTYARDAARIALTLSLLNEIIAGSLTKLPTQIKEG